MRRTLLLATAAIVTALGAQPALAQGAAAAPVAARQGVVAYPAEFFAASRPATALDMINRVPGFSLDTGNNARGFAGTGGNVLIDGERPATKSDPLDEILRRTAASAVERIELISPGAAGIDMQGKSLLANVVLKTKARVERVMTFSPYLYGDGYVGPMLEMQVSKSEGVNLLEGAVRAYTDRTDGTAQGARRRYRPDGTLYEVADIDLWDRIWGGSAKGSLQRGAFGGKYRLNAVVQNDRFERREEQTFTLPGPARAVNTEDSNVWVGELGGQFDRPLGERLTAEIIGLQRIEKSDYLTTSRAAAGASSFAEDATSGESIARAVLRWRPSETLTLEGGGETAFNFIDSTTLYQDAGGREAAEVRVEELRGEATAKASWRPDPKLSIEAGARLELSRISQTSHVVSTFGGLSDTRAEQDKDLVYLKPRLAVSWTPTKTDQFRFRIERTVGQLNFGDFVATTTLETGTVDARNPDLEPNRQWIYEAIYERKFWSSGAIVFRLQHVEIEDAVDLVPVGPFSAPGNIGPGEQQSLRIDLTVPLARLGLTGGQIRGFMSWVESSVTDPTTLASRRLSGQAPRACEWHYIQDLPGGRWSYGAGYFCATSSTSFRVNELRRTMIEEQFETFVQYKPSPDLSIRVDLQNMTARTRLRERYVFDGPRSTGKLVFFESRPVPFDPWLWLRVRKSF